MTLSVCCLTTDPPARVAHMLARLRSVADEIILAVDSRVEPATLGPYNGLVDRLFSVQVGRPMEQVFPWLHAQCTGDWILRMDGDEVPSPELVEALPALIADRSVLQYNFPRRWLFPDENHWLDEWPWAPDYQNRLMRNDATLWLPGISHTAAEDVRPARFLEAPIYHLANILTGREQREAKVDAYLQIPENHRELLADRYVDHFYVPERHHGLAPAPVPEGDRESIRSFLTATPTDEATAPPMQVVPQDEVGSAWAARKFEPEGYTATIKALEADLTLAAGEAGQLMYLRISNDGETTWAGGSRKPVVRVGCRWLTRDGTPLTDETYSQLPVSVPPGDSCTVALRVSAPKEPGAYLLAVDLVAGTDRWFGSTARIEVSIQPSGIPQEIQGSV